MSKSENWCVLYCILLHRMVYFVLLWFCIRPFYFIIMFKKGLKDLGRFWDDVIQGYKMFNQAHTYITYINKHTHISHISHISSTHIYHSLHEYQLKVFQPSNKRERAGIWQQQSENWQNLYESTLAGRGRSCLHWC